MSNLKFLNFSFNPACIFWIDLYIYIYIYIYIYTVKSNWLSKALLIGLIHDSGDVGFQIAMQISHVLCWGQTLEKKEN